MTKNRRAKQKNRQAGESYWEGMTARLSRSNQPHLLRKHTGRQPHTSRGFAVAGLSRYGGTGRTTIVLHVGAQLAADGKRVLLVDLDRQASLTELCCVPRRRSDMGGGQRTANNRQWNALTERVPYAYAAGNLYLFDASMLPATRDWKWLGELIDWARAEFDLVLLDPSSNGIPLELLADFTDFVYSVVKIPDGLVSGTAFELSPRFEAHQQARRARADVLNWLDEQYYDTDDEEFPLPPEGDEDDQDEELPDPAAFVQEIAAEGLEEFGEEWVKASQAWVRSYAIDKATIDKIGWDDAIESVLYTDIDQTFPIDASDEVSVPSVRSPSGVAQVLAEHNDRGGFSFDSAVGRHLGAVLTLVPAKDKETLDAHRVEIRDLLSTVPKDAEAAAMSVDELDGAGDLPSVLRLRGVMAALAAELWARIDARGKRK